MPPIPLNAVFFKTGSGAEPVRDWLRSLDEQDRRALGQDIRTVQIGWPLGMPLVRKMEPDLWEIRSHLADGIGRILFTCHGNTLILLHGFIKKTQATPKHELDLARERLHQLRSIL